MNTAQTTMQPQLSEAERFGTAHLTTIVHDLEGARVILRMVLLALDAEHHGAISHRDNMGDSRWSAAISAALNRLCGVRETLMETPYAPAIDWPTPFALISALDSALWGSSCRRETILTHAEMQIALQVLIDSVDDLLACAEGVKL